MARHWLHKDNKRETVMLVKITICLYAAGWLLGDILRYKKEKKWVAMVITVILAIGLLYVAWMEVLCM